MSRAKGGYKTRRRRKKILRMAKGFRGGRSKLFKSAKETVERSLAYSYRDRRTRKRDFRRLWIQRINAAARENGISYSLLISGMKTSGIEVDRKALADLAVNDPDGFAQIAKAAKEALQTKTAAQKK